MPTPPFMGHTVAPVAAAAAGGSLGAALARLGIWFDPADAATVTLATGVSSITNKGYLGDAAVQATTANQPAYLTNAVNGHSVLDFDGVNDSLLTGNLTLTATSISIYVVIKRKSHTGQDAIVGWNGTFSGGILAFFGKGGQDWADEDVIGCENGFISSQLPRAIAANAASTDGAWHVLRIDLGPASGVFLDGVALTNRVAGNTSCTTITAQPFSIGIVGTSVPNGNITTGDIILAIDPLTTDHALIQGYLKPKWLTP